MVMKSRIAGAEDLQELSLLLVCARVQALGARCGSCDHACDTCSMCSRESRAKLAPIVVKARMRLP